MSHTARASLLAILLFAIPAIGTCAGMPPQSPAKPVRSLTYQTDVRPIFEKKCLACHGCYDAPCQLKMEALEGLDRGASKMPVYAQRARAGDPTRLFMDAQTTAGWRDKGFFSVIDSTTGLNNSVLFRMLELGRAHEFTPGQPLPDDIVLGLKRQNTCPMPDQMDDYAKDHPLGGMPLGAPALTNDEFRTVQTWLRQGAPLGDDRIELSKGERGHIKAWQDWLNRAGKRRQLVARWLYEHLFLAHLYFDDGSGERPAHFFQLVRSKTPPGKPLAPIATPRPNNPPGGPFWYRLRPVRGAIVHKTHITYALTDAKRARMQKLFFSGHWTVKTLPGYGDEERANPFITFAAIPARARYQVMLDDAEYFVRTFIRGPVCRGQVATDVIRDQFWTVFQNPDRDLYITDTAYRKKVSPLIGLPGQEGSLLDLGPQWIKYTHRRNKYLKARHDAYARHYPHGPTWNSVWDGDGHNSNALLTIFRHHDNASVRKGLIGDYPLTTWVMDYPLLERSYYNLVVNFNVFGSVSHQAQTRLYFDLIRNGAEQNTLRYLPAQARKKVLDNWYQDTGKIKLLISYADVDTDTPTAIAYHSATPMNEFNADLVKRFAGINARPDPINRCDGEHCYRGSDDALQKKAEQAFSSLASVTGAQMPVVKQMPEASLIQVIGDNGELALFSLLRNRAHSNVAFMLGESLRYEPGQDTLTLYPGVLTSYPNFMFKVKEADLGAFTAAMQAVKNKDGFIHLVVDRFGIRRTQTTFWDDFQAPTRYMEQHEPIQAGLLDLNRYRNF